MTAEKQPGGGKHINLVTTEEQAKDTLRIIFSGYKADALTDGIILWLHKLENPVCLQMFLGLPELMEEYSLDDFLRGEVKVDADCNKQAVRTVGVAASLLSLITACWELFGKEIHEHPACRWPYVDPEEETLEIIKGVVELLSLDDIQRELALSLLAIIGRKYYDLFIEKLKPLDNNASIQRLDEFQKDPELKEHIQFVIWYGLMRCLLDAVYFYFGQENNSPQKDKI